jgi:hypothetical protein
MRKLIKVILSSDPTHVLKVNISAFLCYKTKDHEKERRRFRWFSKNDYCHRDYFLRDRSYVLLSAVGYSRY